MAPPSTEVSSEENATIQVQTKKSAGSAGRNQEPRQHVCSVCSTCFRRLDHLKRHMRLHSGGKRYRCPCGDTFTRSDVLAQHLRQCNKVRNVSHPTDFQQTRSKRACDRCAKLKMKCDSQTPCNQCRGKTVACEFTRIGYKDPYEGFEIDINRQCNQQGDGNPTKLPSLPMTPAVNDDHSSSDPLSFIAQTAPPNAVEFQTLDPTLLPTPQASEAVVIPSLDTFTFDDIDLMPMDLGFGGVFDWNAIDPSFTFDGPPSEREAIPNYSLPLDTQLPRVRGFSVKQLDPLEAKCAAIRALLLGSEPLVTAEMIDTCITREKVIQCVDLYGLHFHRNFPLLHLPTFNLVEASPFLVFATMLVGAVYSGGLIPTADITKFSMRLLVLIEKQPHEIDMQAPSLETIQAGIIICGILVCFRNETAARFVSVYFARNISMADRAGIFNPGKELDIASMTEENFDWTAWREQEWRRRIGCEILCQDMAACVFQGKSPSFSPLRFDVELPCYEACWEAQTASECFQRLKLLPRQMRVSEASRKLRTSFLDNCAHFEASAFGMFTLMMGLHGFISQTLQEDVEPACPRQSFLAADETTQSGHGYAHTIAQLQQDLSGATVASLADSSVAAYASPAVKRLNGILNAWRTTWELRRVREDECENINFSADPLPFWWLGKLYIALHVHSRAIDAESEFAVSTAKAGDMKAKITLQAKIIGWLSRFRRCGKEQTEFHGEGSVLPRLMKPYSPV